MILKISLKPLGKIKGDLGEFDKSLAASNARVLAFGASAGAIYAVQRALSETVRATIEVEKSLAEVNVILGTSQKKLAGFGNELFNIAKRTGRSFQDVAIAGGELARQGLSMEETLKRTSDAMVLARFKWLGCRRVGKCYHRRFKRFQKCSFRFLLRLLIN